jgi:23S rRNA-/tRNA-specific pseudouridylate synthase
MDYPRRELKIIAENIPLNIVYEDDQLIVINKPVGWLYTRAMETIPERWSMRCLPFQRSAVV